MIKPNTKYTKHNSDLVINVLQVHHISKEKEYVKFKATLSHKKYGYLYETKNYKLPLHTVSMWVEYK